MSRAITTLKDSGLTDNEAKVYLAALELGGSTVQELGKKSGVKRTTVYTIIEGLKQKGLLSQTKKGKKALFLAESPENLVSLSEKRCQLLKEALPELKSIYNVSGPKPKLRFYEGREGYLSVYENILKEKPKELLVIASYENFIKHVELDYEESWTKKRIKLGMKLRWLDFQTKKVEEKAAEGKKGLREVKYLPKEKRFTSTTFIYSDKIIIVSGKQKEFLAIVIENQEFFEMFKQLFEMLWQNC